MQLVYYNVGRSMIEELLSRFMKKPAKKNKDEEKWR